MNIKLMRFIADFRLTCYFADTKKERSASSCPCEARCKTRESACFVLFSVIQSYLWCLAATKQNKTSQFHFSFLLWSSGFGLPPENTFDLMIFIISCEKRWDIICLWRFFSDDLLFRSEHGGRKNTILVWVCGGGYRRRVFITILN